MRKGDEESYIVDLSRTIRPEQVLVLDLVALRSFGHELDHDSVRFRLELHHALVIVDELLAHGELWFVHVRHVAVPNAHVRLRARLAAEVHVQEFYLYLTQVFIILELYYLLIFAIFPQQKNSAL